MNAQVQLRGCCERGETARDLVVRGDLAAIDLTGLRADTVKLDDVDLRGATLSGSQWFECTLCDVRLDRAVGHGLVIRMSLLEGVRARAADLRGAKLENCQLAGIVLDRATLCGGSLIDSDLTRASLRDADLQEVDATGAMLRGADLRGANLRGTVLAEADLRGADLRGAELEGADLDGADLRGAVLADDEPLPTEPPAAESPAAPNLPPQFANLVEELAPSVVDILQRGKHRGVLDEQAFARIVEDIRKLGITTLDPDESFLAADGPMGQILERVNEFGVAPLVAALGERHAGSNADPPPAVAELIRSLMGDAQLGPDATAEDLAVHLAKLVQSSLSPQGTNK
jgi:uncharacterized protein YjbI with pentapeptide repeats